MATNLYLIEDDTRIHDFVRASLAVKADWRLVGVSDSLAHARVHAGPAQADMYLVDLGLPDGRSETLMQLLAQTNPAAEKLVFTVFGEESRLIATLEAGATGYVLNGYSGPELLAAVELIRTDGAPISALLARMLLNRFRATTATAALAKIFSHRFVVFCSLRKFLTISTLRIARLQVLPQAKKRTFHFVCGASQRY